MFGETNFASIYGTLVQFTTTIDEVNKNLVFKIGGGSKSSKGGTMSAT